MKQRVFTVDGAIPEIQKYHDNSSYRPLLVGVHGCGQNAGKLYFCRKACESLKQESRLVAYWTYSPCFDPVLRDYFEKLEYLFYRIGFDSQMPAQRNITSWDKQIRPFTRRCVDVNVVIFNPKFQNPDLGYLLRVFDIVIPNPHPVNRERNMMLD